MTWSVPWPAVPVLHKARVVCLGGPRDGLVLPVTAGEVTVDATAKVRRTARLTVAGIPEWTPAQTGDALDPRTGTELRVETHGPAGWTPQGVFSVDSPAVRRDPSGVDLTVDVSDRSRRVQLAGMDRRWVISAGMPVSDAIRGILTQIAPWCPSSFPDTPAQVAADVLLEFGDDPWSTCLDLAQSVGLDLFVDPTGVVRTAPATAALAATPVQVTWLSIDREIDTAKIVNHVRAEWSPARPDPVPKGWDDKGGFEDAVDDTSSTSVLSWVGRRVTLVKGDRSLLTSASAARQAAQIRLLEARDATYSGAGTVAPDPRLDVGQVVVLDGDRYRITRLRIDLGGAATSVTLGTPPESMATLIARASKAPTDRRTREIVTSTDPLRTALASDPTGSQVAVTPTAAVTGVQVGDVVEVLHKGAGQRIAVARFIGGTSAYGMAVLLDDPLCLFALDETTGTPQDTTGNVEVKSMAGVTLGAPSIGDGVYSASINGATSAGIVLPKEAFAGVRNFTVEILARATNMSAARYLTSLVGSGSVFGFEISHTAANAVQAATGATWPTAIGSAVSEPAPTTTHHWAVTYDGTDAKFFRDGVQIASEAQTWSATDPVNDLTIGGRAGSTGFLGQVAGFAFHKEALPASRLLAHTKAAEL